MWQTVVRTRWAIAAIVILILCSGAQAITCPLPTTIGVVICTPGNEDTANSPVEISAAGKGTAQLHLWKIYVDGVVAWTSPQFVDSIDTSLSLPAGQHRITAKVWDVNGSNYSKTIFISVASGTTGACPATVNRTVVICSIHYRGGHLAVLADAADQKPVRVMKLYLEGVAVCTKFATELAANGNQLSCGLFPYYHPGQTRVTVKAWDSLGSFSVTKNIFLP